MNAVRVEYLSKGLFLGLWAYLALIEPPRDVFFQVVGWTAGGLGIGVLAGIFQQILRGYRPGANPLGFLLMVLLDSPVLIYAGLIGGLGVGVTTLTDPPPDRDWLGYCALAGVVLGFGFHQVIQVQDRLWRLCLGLGIGGALVYLIVSYLEALPSLQTLEAQREFAIVILTGLPFFYVLTFCGETEESEVEIAALCAGLGVGLYLLRFATNLPMLGDKAAFLIPVTLYFVYATSWLVPLRVFKHNLRGFGYMYLGRVPQAIACFGRALQIHRGSDLAAQGLYALHRKVDVTKLDERTVGLLNFDISLAIAADALVGERPPTAEQRAEALRLLDLVERHKPTLLPRADYLRAVALTHAKDFDGAAAALTRLLDPETPYTDPGVRAKTLFPAWDLAVRLHPEIAKRVGPGELAKPGRRIQAIAAIERKLVESPGDGSAVELQRIAYEGLTEAEFAASVSPESGPPAEFNYDLAEQLGLALADDPDSARRERGAVYLRIAGRGLPARGPSIFTRLADLASAAGQPDYARNYLEQVKRAGLQVGAGKLPADQKTLYTSALRRLTDDAANRGDFEAAIADWRLYIEAGNNEVEALRRLADLHEKSGDVLNALLVTERGLLHSKNDADLKARREKYYYSVEPDRVAAVREQVSRWFDVDYCVRTAAKVVETADADAETLAWGLHLARVARAAQPSSQAAMLAEAKLRGRLGESTERLKLLEDIREMPRGSGEDETAWYQATRLLGDMYLDELDRPDLAIACFNDYRNYSRSGAETLYRLGEAHEKKGETESAKKYFKAVTAFSGHPKYWDATEAVRRLGG